MSQSPPVDFYFYLKCAKPLILALSSLKDRALASAWLKHLAEDTSVTDMQKSDYMRLLIYFLQKRKLSAPFNDHPSKYKTLSEIPQEGNFFQAVKSSRSQPYISDFSGDLFSYVAYQNIENFGVHCYYALAQKPFFAWERFDKSLYSPGVGATLREPSVGTQSSKITDELEEKKSEFAEKLQKKIRGDNKKVMFLVSPIGTESESDDRIPPSWGSNLIQTPKFDNK